jgi:hypothetical protein
MYVSLKSIIVVTVVLVAITGCAAQTVSSTPTLAPTIKLVSTPTAIPSITATLGPTTAPVATASSATPKATADPDDVRLWGDELTLDQFIDMCKGGNVAYIEWFMEYDRLRINTIQGGRFNYRNEKTKLDMPRVLEEHGVKVGDGGIQLDFET